MLPVMDKIECKSNHDHSILIVVESPLSVVVVGGGVVGVCVCVCVCSLCVCVFLTLPIRGTKTTAFYRGIDLFSLSMTEGTPT